MEQIVTTTTNGLSIQYIVLPTKKEIIQRLFLEQKITFDELWILIQEKDLEVRYVSQGNIIWPSGSTGSPHQQLPWTTCSENSKQDGNT